MVAAAQRLEKAAALFEELRQVLRLSSRPHERLLRGRGPCEGHEVAKTIQKRLDQWRDRLRQRKGRERDADKRADQETVLGYLEKYQKELVGHVIQLAGRQKPFVVPRTNNLAEHCFGSIKQGLRRKVGAKKLTRYVQAMRAEELLVANLADPEYVDLVCHGREVARRWARLFPLRDKQRGPIAASEQWIRDKASDGQWVARTRKRLANLGWFMKCLKEPLAALWRSVTELRRHPDGLS